MSNREREYIFYGRVLPYRVTPTLDLAEYDFSSPVGELKIDTAINHGVVVVVVQTDSEPNIYTLRNIVHSLTKSYTDMFAYSNGFYYDLEIMSVFMPNNRTITFPVSYAPLVEQTGEKEFEQWVAEMYSGFSGETGIYLRRAVSDLRDALEHADDSLFHCYRALESLKQYFAEENMDKREKWDTLWEELDMNNELAIGKMKDYAEDIRHGEPRNTSAEQREKIYCSLTR